jgi:hypothetical protein
MGHHGSMPKGPVGPRSAPIVSAFAASPGTANPLETSFASSPGSLVGDDLDKSIGSLLNVDLAHWHADLTRGDDEFEFDLLRLPQRDSILCARVQMVTAQRCLFSYCILAPSRKPRILPRSCRFCPAVVSVA